MQTDSTFEKWLTSISLADNIIPVQPGIDPKHTSILPRIAGLQESPDFISLLAHEVRSPLSIINLSVEMLKTHPPANDSAIYLDIIARNSLLIDNKINELILNRLAPIQPVEKYMMEH